MTEPKPSHRQPPDPRLTAALVAAKVVSSGIRRAGRGGGTAAPGLIADWVDPRLLTKLTGRLSRGVIVVAGTNGKTTTSRMIADILEADGARVVHNRSGSNLVRGVAAAFAEQAGLGGNPGGDIGVIETDEAAFPEIVRLTNPRVILLNNLFRDQLDRYGELNTIATRWAAAIARLPSSTTLVVNADDPTLAEITRDVVAQRVTFGLAESRYRLDALPHASDSAVCRRCGADLEYEALYVSHLGDWRCPRCSAIRPALDIAGSAIELMGVESLRMTVRNKTSSLDLETGVPGLYNAYNVLAATAAAETMGVGGTSIAWAMKNFKSAFGRIERVQLRNRTLTLALVKNPVGFNEVLRMLTTATDGLTVPTMIAINDRHADGRDVSWLWDVDFELLAQGTAALSTAGLRGPDMANRLKYAGVAVERITPQLTDLRSALDAFVDSIPEGGSGYILPTYTAMLDLRSILADLGAVEKFWEQ